MEASENSNDFSSRTNPPSPEDRRSGGPTPSASAMPPPLWKRAGAEFVGTFILVLGPVGTIMGGEFSGAPVANSVGALASGLAVAAAIFAVGSISGAHINPAVTAAFAAVGRFPWKEVPVYGSAQLCGAIAAVAVLRALLGPVGNLGAHIPSGSAGQSIGMELVLTFALMLVVMAVATDRKVTRLAGALVIGLVVTVDIMVGGPISGGSMNPARSLGPALVGWIWTHHWIYWVGPIVGAIVTALIYDRILDRK